MTVQTTSVRDVTQASFEADVLEQSKHRTVVVDFWAPWCGPCRALGPVLERLAEQSGGQWVLAKLNTDDNQPLARRYGIQGIPAVKAFRNGEVVAEFVGALPEPKVREWLEMIVPSPATQLADAAAARIAAGDLAGAAERYRDALAIDPSQPDALLHTAHDALVRGDRTAAKEALGRLRSRDRLARSAEAGKLEFALETPPPEARAAWDTAPDDPATRYGRGCALAAGGQWEQALALFLDLVRRDRAWGDDAGRKAMLRVFDIVGMRSPIADEWRSRLSMELYK